MCSGSLSIPAATQINANAPATSHSVMPSAWRSAPEQYANKARTIAAVNDTRPSAGRTSGGGTNQTSKTHDAAAAITTTERSRCGPNLLRAGPYVGPCSDFHRVIGPPSRNARNAVDYGGTHHVDASAPRLRRDGTTPHGRIASSPKLGSRRRKEYPQRSGGSSTR